MQLPTSAGGGGRADNRRGFLGARAYLAWDRWLRRLIAGTQGFADGLVLGFASDAVLDRLDEEYYSRTSYYRTDRFNERGLFSWEARAIENYFPSAGRIVVLGAGGGRETLALRRLGYDALGYEPHPALRQFGSDLLERSGVGGTLHPIGRSCWPVDERFDAVIVGWGMYHSVRGRQRRVDLLHEISRSVEPGAPILLAYFTRRGNSLYHRTVARVASSVRRLRRRDAIVVGDVLTPFYAHMFTDAEIAAEVADAGLQLVAHGDDGYGWAVAEARRPSPNRELVTNGC